MIKNLKLLRKTKGVSQQQLASVIGTSQQSVNKYENHSVEPDIQTLCTIADFFNTSVDYLIGHIDVDHKIEKITKYDLNDEEIRLVEDFRELSASEQESIKFIIKNYFDRKR